MRILQINNTHYIKGGADRVYFNTIKLLEQHGHDVICFSAKSPNNEASIYSKYFISVENSRELSFFRKVLNSAKYLYNREAAKNIKALIKEEKPDIAHIHLFYGGISSSILKILHKNNIPVVVTIHDYRLLCPANAYLNSSNEICEKCNNKFYLQCTIDRCLEGKLFYSFILSLEAYVRKYFVKPVNLISHFIFVSNFSKNKHIEVFSKFYEKSSHIYNFSPIAIDTSTHSSKDSYFLYFGRLSKEKGIFTLLNAAKKNNLPLKIVGGGPLSDEVKQFCINTSNVQFLGHHSGESLNDIIKKSSYVIVPSEWYENNPMTVIEAFSYGIPVIGARIGGIPEIVEDCKTGFLFKSRDENDLSAVLIKSASVSTDEYLSMSENARNFAIKHFSSESHYQQLISLYSKIVNGNK